MGNFFDNYDRDFPPQILAKLEALLKEALPKTFTRWRHGSFTPEEDWHEMVGGAAVLLHLEERGLIAESGTPLLPMGKRVR